jgi:hypothetical protein
MQAAAASSPAKNDDRDITLSSITEKSKPWNRFQSQALFYSSGQTGLCELVRWYTLVRWYSQIRKRAALKDSP